MDFLLKVAVPDISIFTKLDNVHVEYFKNKKAI
jgi:UDP-N-acetylmuramyl pentapeptide synthase